MLGRLVWMILDASGDKGIGPPGFLAGAPGTRLDEDKIAAALGSGLTVQSGREPGVLVRMEPGGALLLLNAKSGQPKARGRWHMEGRVLVLDLPGQKEKTWQVKMHQNAIRLFDMYGNLVDVFTIRQP